MSHKAKIYLAFIVTALLLTAMVKSTGAFKYRYAVGEKWAYSDLIAERDFSIVKSEDDLHRSRIEFDRKFMPIYRFSVNSSENAKSKVLQDYGVTLQEVRSSDSVFLSKGKRLGAAIYLRLEQIYDRGVMPEQTVVSVSDSSMRVVRDGVLQVKRFKELLTIQQAKEWVVNRVSESFSSLPRDTLERYVLSNILPDQNLTETFKSQEFDNIALTKGFVPKGTILVNEGDVIDHPKAELIDSYVREINNNDKSDIGNIYKKIGNLLYIVALLFLTFVFLVYVRSKFAEHLGNILFILFIYLLMMGLTRVTMMIDGVSLYIVPFAVAPLYIMTFYDIRMSIFEFFSILFVCIVTTPAPFELMFVNAIAGMSGVFVLQNSYHRKRVFRAVAAILGGYVFGFVTINFMKFSSWEAIEWMQMLWFIPNVLIVLALYQLIYVFEHIFGFFTNITLFELCDTNRSILQELAQKAPGTFQHSLQVANLASAAAKRIGADSLLARTGALYHDIGKMNNPVYFIENVSGEFNPHNNLDPLQSAEYIKQHVIDGVALAKSANIPSVIVDFITSHHGDSLIYYFYHAHKRNNGEDVDENAFKYLGPPPATKEQAICMMADAIEAASRSLKEYSHETIKELVDSIVDTQIEQKQFINSPITLAEIELVKDEFVQKISLIYHTRIAYPSRN